MALKGDEYEVYKNIIAHRFGSAFDGLQEG
jgi:hypothetical protein